MKGTCDINIKTFKKIILAILILLVWELIILGNKVYADNEQVEISDVSFKDIINSKQNIKAISSLPTQYDLRKSNPYGFANHGNINIRVESQMGDTCWAWASFGALRTYLAVKGYNNGTTPDLSEWHMNYLTSRYYKSKYGGNRLPATDEDTGMGGIFNTAVNYFKYNNGPILETTFPVGTKVNVNSSTELNRIDAYEPIYYVHKIIEFPSVVKNRQSNGTTKIQSGSGAGEISSTEMTSIRNSIKEHIMNYGGLFCSIRTNNNFCGNDLGSPYDTLDGKFSRYDDGSISANDCGSHAVTIIGWNDNYNKNKFNAKNNDGNIVHPSSNGAYLALNSWGSSWGENGYFWISYEDYFVEADLNGYISVNQTENYCEYTFTNSSTYTKMKDIFSSENGDCTTNNTQKTVKLLDLIVNDFNGNGRLVGKLDLSESNLNDTDLNEIFKYNFPKIKQIDLSGNNISNLNKLYICRDNIEKINLSNNKIENCGVLSQFGKLTTLILDGNKIESLQSLNLSQYSEVSVKNQKITKTVEGTVTEVSYPNIFTEAKKSSSKLYSSSNFTLTGCYEKSDGTGIVLTSNTATVKINSGNAEGTTMTITRKVDNVPTIQIIDNTTNKTLESGTTIEKNTKIRLVFSDDNDISGYNITTTTTQPTTWLTQYDQTPIANVRIVNKTFTISGNNYIWVKDSAGNTTRALLIVKAENTLTADINGDGKINITDVMKLRRYIANSRKWPLSDTEKSKADINGNGIINITDLLILRRYIAANSNASIKAKHPDWVW